MNTDFRVAVDFFSHHKARKLKKRLSSDGLISLLQLWAYAAKLRTDGELSGMDAEDIEIAACWDGGDGAFVAALVEVGFLDQRGDAYSLHDWVENNSWAADAADRQDKARFSRLATVNRAAFDKLKATGVNAISKDDYERLTTVRRSSDERRTDAGDPPTPSPAPSPAPTHKDNEDSLRSSSCPERPCGDSGPMPATLEAVITLPLNTGEEHPVTQGEIDQWQDLYPSVDVPQELRNMKGWLLANRQKRKTKSGVGRFIQGWLAREQDKGGAALRDSSAPPGNLNKESQADRAARLTYEAGMSVLAEMEQRGSQSGRALNAR